MMNDAMTTHQAESVTPHELDVAGSSRPGRSRARNEDAYLIATLQRSMLVHDASPDAARGWFSGEQAGRLLLVADGMGGQGSGDIASQVAIRTIAGYLLNVMPWAAARQASRESLNDRGSLAGVRRALSSALTAGDTTVKSAGARVGNLHMGTTLTAALINWPALYVAHVGDSRCCLFRSGSLSRLTTDHTIANRLASEGNAVDASSQWHHVLWNALGGDEEVPTPELVKLTLEPGDQVLLCSDGLTKALSDTAIAEVLGGSKNSTACCEKLVTRAYEQGATDDVTVMIAGS